LLSRQQGRSETEEYSSDSESESEDEEELQMILEDLQKQNEELEVSKIFNTYWPFPVGRYSPLWKLSKVSSRLTQ